MEIFKVENSVDPAVIGYVNQQMDTYIGSYEYWGNQSFTKIPNSGKIDFNIKFPTFKLFDRAIRTDFLQNHYSMGRTLLLSPVAKNLLEQNHLDDSQWYSVKVLHKKKKMEYYMLFMPNNRQAVYIDWAASSFSMVDGREPLTAGGVLRFKKIAHLAFSSYEEYISKKVSIRDTQFMVEPDKIFLINPIEYDLFRMSLPLLGYFCSGRMKALIEDASLTGFRFVKVYDSSE